MTPAVVDKFALLRRLIGEMDSVLVAYSGGVDSALVAAVAHEVLRERSLACIGMSPSYPQRELRDAVKLAQTLGFSHRVIDTNEGADPNYAANPANRCYFCKSELYTRLRDLAQRDGWNAIADGVHADDVHDHVNGMRAGHERGVRSPLLEARIGKSDVREIARYMGLAVWDKPAMACMSSRVPTGVAITPQLLRQIEQAEDVLAENGFRQFRVRHHGEIARIELPAEDLPRAIELHDVLAEGIKAAGYRFVTLDLAGFRSGSLNPQLVALQVRR